jgi:hypothetical protein
VFALKLALLGEKSGAGGLQFPEPDSQLRKSGAVRGRHQIGVPELRMVIPLGRPQPVPGGLRRLLSEYEVLVYLGLVGSGRLDQRQLQAQRGVVDGMSRCSCPGDAPTQYLVVGGVGLGGVGDLLLEGGSALGVNGRVVRF